MKKQLVCIWEYLCLIKRKINEEYHWIIMRLLYRVHVMDSLHTAKYIKSNHCSIARFGDGEFGIALAEWNTGFQVANDELRDALLNVLKNPPSNLLICVPHYYNYMYGAKPEVKRVWTGLCKNKDRQKRIVTLLRDRCGSRYIFGDAQVTRPYMDMKTSTMAKKTFPVLKAIWGNEHILIVEGDKTRLGIGNDLFIGAKSIQRILAPAENAFDKYSEIMKAVMEHYRGQLVLIALGPTATVLAADLAERGIWALDIGHVDMEYMWYLMRAKEKVALKNKYVNEVSDGNNPEECQDEQYLAQIIERIS